jgi:DNA-binding IclR family transcriptional regulator
MPFDKTRAFVEREIAAGSGTPFGVDSLEAASVFFSSIRRNGLGIARSVFLPGVGAIAVPVFDQHDRLAGAITALGLETLFEASPSGLVAEELRRLAMHLTERLGGHEPHIA